MCLFLGSGDLVSFCFGVLQWGQEEIFSSDLNLCLRSRFWKFSSNS